MPSEGQVATAARIIQEVCGPGYRAAMTLARRVLEAVEGQWATATGGQEEDRLRGTPFGSPSRVRTGSFGTDQLNSLAEKLMIALGDSTTMDTLTGDPKVLVDRIIAERDGFKLQATANVDYIKALLSERDDLKTTLRAATEELVRLNDELTEAHAEIKRLQAQLPSPPVHEIEILAEMATESGIRVEFKCPYPKCHYEGSVHAPTGGLANRMADALATSHEEEMEEDPDGEG